MRAQQETTTVDVQGYGKAGKPVPQQGGNAHGNAHSTQTREPLHSRSPSPTAQAARRNSQSGANQSSRTPSPAPGQRAVSPMTGKPSGAQQHSPSPQPASKHVKPTGKPPTTQGGNGKIQMGFMFTDASPAPPPPGPQSQHSPAQHTQVRKQSKKTPSPRKDGRSFRGHFPAEFAMDPTIRVPVFNLACRITCYEDPSHISGYLVPPSHVLSDVPQPHSSSDEDLMLRRMFRIVNTSSLPLLSKYQGELNLRQVCEWKDAMLARFPNIEDKAHVEPRSKRAKCSRPSTRAQAWQQLLQLYEERLRGEYGDIPEKLLDYFRLDALGNVVALHAAFKSTCSFSIDHIHPWSRGGTTEFPNLMALADVANTCKSDELWPFIIQWRRSAPAAPSMQQDPQARPLPPVTGNFVISVSTTDDKRKVSLVPVKQGLQVEQLWQLWTAVQNVTAPSASGAPPVALGAAGPVQLLCTLLMMPWGGLLQVRNRSATTLSSTLGLASGRELMSAAAALLVAAQQVPNVQGILDPRLATTVAEEDGENDQGNGTIDDENASVNFSRTSTQHTLGDLDDEGVEPSSTHLNTDHESVCSENDNERCEDSNIMDQWDSQLVSTDSLLQRLAQLVDLMSVSQSEQGASNSRTVQTLTEACSQLRCCEREHQGRQVHGQRPTDSNSNGLSSDAKPQAPQAALTPLQQLCTSGIPQDQSPSRAQPPPRMGLHSQQGLVPPHNSMSVMADGFLMIPPGTPVFYDPVVAAAQRHRQLYAQDTAAVQPQMWMPARQYAAGLPTMHPTAVPAVLSAAQPARQPSQVQTLLCQQEAGQLSAYQQHAPRQQLAQLPSCQQQLVANLGAQFPEQGSGCAIPQGSVLAAKALVQPYTQDTHSAASPAAGLQHAPATPTAAAAVPAGQCQPQLQLPPASVQANPYGQPMPQAQLLTHLTAQPQAKAQQPLSTSAYHVAYLGSRPAMYTHQAAAQVLDGNSKCSSTEAGSRQESATGAVNGSGGNGRVAAGALTEVTTQHEPVKPVDGNCVRKVWTRMFC